MKIETESTNELPVFYGCEQPETCRKCGSRTDFEDLPDGTQLHQCLNCGKWYIVEFDESLVF